MPFLKGESVMAFDRQNITNQGIYLLKRLKEGHRLSFTGMFTEVDAIPPAQMPTGGGVTFAQAETDTERFSKGVLWNVTPTRTLGADGKTDIRAVGRFTRSQDSEEFVMRSAYLFASLVDTEGHVVKDDMGNPMENILFAVASNNDKSVLQSDGRNSLFVTFNVVLTNGFSQVVTIDNGLATLQDLENLQGSSGSLEGLTIRYDKATNDIQLFDGEGNLIDQTNLGVGVGGAGGNFVTVGDTQFVYGDKIWVSSDQVQRHSTTLYILESATDDTRSIVFVSGLDPRLEALVAEDDEALAAYQSAVKVFSVSVQDGALAVTDTGMTYEEALEVLSCEQVRSPELEDFVFTSDDRDALTDENIGQDKAIVPASAKDDIGAAMLWLGYQQMLATDEDLTDEQRATIALHPETITNEQLATVVPKVAIDPADFKAVYKDSDVAALKLKYLALGSSALASATRYNMLRILKGLYEQQIANARDAAKHAVAVSGSEQSVADYKASTRIASDGITFGRESQLFHIGLSCEDDRAEDHKQKIAFSKVEKYDDHGETKERKRTFAFLGDSGMFGGAPLFTVRILACAHYRNGTKNWVLNAIECSDGFDAQVCGQAYNGVKNPSPDTSKNDHLYVSCAENLSLDPFTHVIVDILGYTGSNDNPVMQYKHLGCIVPFDVEKKNLPFSDQFGCGIDLTIPLNNWVQSDGNVPAEELLPDMIIVRAYPTIINTENFELPDVQPGDENYLTYEEMMCEGIVISPATQFAEVFRSGTTRSPFETADLPIDTFVTITGKSTTQAGGHYWYRIIAQNADGAFIDRSGSVSDTPYNAYVSDAVVIPKEHTVEFDEDFPRTYAKIPAGVPFYIWNEDLERYLSGRFEEDTILVLSKSTKNDAGFYAIEDGSQTEGFEGFVFVRRDAEAEGRPIVLDSLQSFIAEKAPSPAPSLNVPARLYLWAWVASVGDTADDKVQKMLAGTENVGPVYGLVQFMIDLDEEDGFGRVGQVAVVTLDGDESRRKVLVAPFMPLMTVLVEDTSALSSYHRIEPLDNGMSEEEAEAFRSGFFIAEHLGYNDDGTPRDGNDNLSDFFDADEVFITDDGSAFGYRDRLGDLVFFNSALCSFDPESVEPYEDTTYTPGARYFVPRDGECRTFASPTEGAAANGRLPHGIELDGVTENGFGKLSDNVWVRLSDGTLNREDAEGTGDTLETVSGESNAVVVYRYIMPDGSAHLIIGTFNDGTSFEGKAVEGTQYVSAVGSNGVSGFVPASAFGLSLTPEQIEDLSEAMGNAGSEDSGIVGLHAVVETTAALPSVDIDGEVVVIPSGSEIEIVGISESEG